MTKRANPEGIKWPSDKKRYDKNYLRLFGKLCPLCKGKSRRVSAKYGAEWSTCTKCNGIGYVEKGQWGSK